MRIEKALYEQFVNIRQLNRARVIGTSSKWYNENRHDAYKVAAHKFCNEGLTSKVYRWLEPLLAKMTFRWMQDIAHQRGLAMEDFLLFQDRELRRCYFFETIMRQSFHPYQWIFFKRRRARFYKVDRAVRGVIVPDWCREEAESRTLAETLENKEAYENFVYKEYMSDQTPSSRWSVLSKWNPLELFLLYGSWRTEAWDRYFYNEVFYDGYTEKEIREAKENPFNLDLSTEAGKIKFESETKRFISLYPGAITRPGE